jgi:UDP-N-acetylglucosamine 2-epimerase
VRLDPEAPFLLVIFHPSTTEFGDERAQVRALLTGLERLALPTLMLWPNIDAGSSRVSKEIRRFRDEVKPNWLRLQTNLTPDDYLVVLSRAAVAVGNSSSFVRDSGFFGTPVVLVGSRQDGREADVNVTRVEVTEDAIVQTVRDQIAKGPYAPSTLYGDGEVSARVAQALSKVEPYVQKRLHYVFEDEEGSEPPE